MALKDFVDNHPLIVVAALTVVVAGTTAGVVQFFASERLSLKEERHQAEIYQLTTRHEAKIDDFSRRFASIERRIGSDPEYFDVTRVAINQDSVLALSSRYKGYLYASPPNEVNWTYSVTNEWDINSRMFPFLVEIAPQELIATASSWIAHLWQYNNAAEVNCKLNIPVKVCRLYFHPSLYAMRVTRDMLARKGKDFLGLLEGSNKKGVGIEKSADVEEIPSALMALNATGANVDESKTKNAKLDALQNFFDEDLANFLLIDRIFANTFMVQTFQNFDYRLRTVQKKGNILYMKGDWVFTKVGVSGLFEGQDLMVSEEWFFVGTSDDGLMVRVIVPTLDGRSEAYDWINRWLSDFRVVL